MNSGVPPTARKARTGELTPPGMTRQARAYSSAERGGLSAPIGRPASSLIIRSPSVTDAHGARGARRAGGIEECIDRLSARVQRGCAQPGERQVRQAQGQRASEALELLPLLWV